MRGKDRKYCIINSGGTLVSGENKSEIGGDTGNVIPEKGYRTVTDNGQEYMYFYENVLGTDWYLMERINVHEIWNTLDRTGYFSVCLIAAFVLCLYPLTTFSKKRIIKPCLLYTSGVRKHDEGCVKDSGHDGGLNRLLRRTKPAIKTADRDGGYDSF